jgi:nucleotidyltransferase/DNA polymerase involved in DNA repair
VSPDARASWWVYLDIDAFYVSCELREHPELRGRAVIVGPSPRNGPSRGVVLSASYEARAFGVRSAQPVGQADRLCPDAVWLPPDFEKYGRISREVFALLHRFSDRVFPNSIDEAALEFPAFDVDEIRGQASKIQAALRLELDLPASLGIAPFRVVAKIACDRAKPGGIVAVEPGRIAEFLAPLPVRAIPGVGPKMEKLLQDHRIATIGELAQRPVRELTGFLGAWARELSALARGVPVEAPAELGGPRSRSTDHTFARDVEAWSEIAPTVQSMAEELARSLDREGLRYGSVGIAFRWSDFTRSQRSRTLGASREGVATLADRALRLARELWDSEQARRRRAVRTVSVRVERLSERTRRQSSLDDYPPGSALEIK